MLGLVLLIAGVAALAAAASNKDSEEKNKLPMVPGPNGLSLPPGTKMAITSKEPFRMTREGHYAYEDQYTRREIHFREVIIHKGRPS